MGHSRQQTVTHNKGLSHVEGAHNFILISVGQHFGIINNLGRIHIMKTCLHEMQIVMPMVRIYLT